MLGTMQDFPLTIRMIFDYGRKAFPDSKIFTKTASGYQEASFAQVAERATRLASALAKLGVGPSDRVGTFCWNNQAHMEAYMAVPCMGAVLHTLNIRLFPEQLVFVVNDAQDKVVIVDDSILPLLARVASQLKCVETYVVVGEGDASALEGHGAKVLRYEELLAAAGDEYDWPEVDERSAAAMCYTSGTTGDPKGVVYSHRSSVLHSMGINSGAVLGLNQHDVLLPVVPMFHANAWGLPYSGWMVGADFAMPDRFLQAEPLCHLIQDRKVTMSGAVPTIWNEVLRFADANPVDFSSLRSVICGGAALPRSLIEGFRDRHGVEIYQGWGMTETSPVAAISTPPKNAPDSEHINWQVMAGQIIGGVEIRLMDDDGKEVPWDGKSTGEIQVRGPWITGSYFRGVDPEKFVKGWLRTGDVGSLTPNGFIRITDRAKDVIKSGGEWISSVDLENSIMSHPQVVEAAVVGVPDQRWDERPLACVVLEPGSTLTPRELSEFLADKVAKWWLPERWCFVSEVPKTSVGKFDKKVLRARFGKGELDVHTLE
jgi:fatty-acyl-CoA synthase